MNVSEHRSHLSRGLSKESVKNKIQGREDLEKIASGYDTNEAIADYLGISCNAVSRLLKKWGVKSPEARRREETGEGKRKKYISGVTEIDNGLDDTFLDMRTGDKKKESREEKNSIIGKAMRRIEKAATQPRIERLSLEEYERRKGLEQNC